MELLQILALLEGLVGLALLAVLAVPNFYGIKELRKKIDYMHKLFDDHLKTTDSTIGDLRKERDFWKKKAGF